VWDGRNSFSHYSLYFIISIKRVYGGFILNKKNCKLELSQQVFTSSEFLPVELGKGSEWVGSRFVLNNLGFDLESSAP